MALRSIIIFLHVKNYIDVLTFLIQTMLNRGNQR